MSTAVVPEQVVVLTEAQKAARTQRFLIWGIVGVAVVAVTGLALALWDLIESRKRERALQTEVTALTASTYGEWSAAVLRTGTSFLPTTASDFMGAVHYTTVGTSAGTALGYAPDPVDGDVWTIEQAGTWSLQATLTIAQTAAHWPIMMGLWVNGVLRHMVDTTPDQTMFSDLSNNLVLTFVGRLEAGDTLQIAYSSLSGAGLVTNIGTAETSTPSNEINIVLLHPA